VSGKEVPEPSLIWTKTAPGRVRNFCLYFRWIANGGEEEASILRIPEAALAKKLVGM
jgi:hypothetical protein